ncbi:uncharacterized protein LOC141849961 [Brevipalpus obovatus]|uniref:uncharacterized protein LOC141849961 n=1 Tax=Brevipalpus obovatus TaxID=246614 RepID=UPI003D9E4CCE
MFLKRAMRYYRVWIYSCNLALFCSTIVFIILFLWTASDFRLSLFPSITFYQPTFIYAYAALILQAGVLQAIGCVGANRMNEKLLNLYLKILLGLLVGDLLVGVIWLFRYNAILKNFKSHLMYRVNNDYGFDSDFQEIWDRVQSEHHCCGIDTPFDYNTTQWFQREHNTYVGSRFLVPQSCCASNHKSNKINININSPKSVSNAGLGSLTIVQRPFADCADNYIQDSIYTTGCYREVLGWLKSSFNTLSVIGFCVISFLKLCFSFILRYEIREMIQKIQIIKGERERSGSTIQNLEAYLPRPSIQNDSSQALLSSQSPQTVKHRHRANCGSRAGSGGCERDFYHGNPRPSLILPLFTAGDGCNVPNLSSTANPSATNPTEKNFNQIKSGSADPIGQSCPSKTASDGQAHLNASASLPNPSCPKTNSSEQIPKNRSTVLKENVSKTGATTTTTTPITTTTSGKKTPFTRDDSQQSNEAKHSLV